MPNVFNQGEKNSPVETRQVVHQSDIPPQTIKTRHLKLENGLPLMEKTTDPTDPAEGYSIIWQSDGTGSGDDGDIMIKITAGGTTKTATLVDFSAI